MKDNPLMKYSEQLAIEIEKMCKSLDNKKDNANTILQIRKSSSSVFANITEAQYPQSLPDMLSKFKIARKECVETESWLKLLFSSGSINEQTFKNYRNICGRIQRMLTASCITIEKKIEETPKRTQNVKVKDVFLKDGFVHLKLYDRVNFEMIYRAGKRVYWDEQTLTLFYKGNVSQEDAIKYISEAVENEYHITIVF